MEDDLSCVTDEHKEPKWQRNVRMFFNQIKKAQI
jgi:hypothetical protein